MLYIDLYTRTSSLCCMVLLGTSPTSFLGEVQFFFSGLPAGPTYWPLVWHSNSDAPLTTCTVLFYLLHNVSHGDCQPTFVFPVKLISIALCKYCTISINSAHGGNDRYIHFFSADFMIFLQFLKPFLQLLFMVSALGQNDHYNHYISVFLEQLLCVTAKLIEKVQYSIQPLCLCIQIKVTKFGHKSKEGPNVQC